MMMNTASNNTFVSKYKPSITVLLIVLAIYSALIISMYHYERFSADATLYLNIAEKYLRGEFSNAINGYWGPMLSWLLIPFLYFGVSDVFAINALNLLIGVFTITGVWILSFRFDISDRVRRAVLIAVLPIILFVSIVELFDFLLLCFLVYYLGVIFNSEYHKKAYAGIACGVLGAFAYFSKSYAFPFFIVHFSIMNIVHYLRCITKEDRRRVLQHAFAGMIVFLVVSSPWIFLISSKYGHFTISNMGKGNFSAMAPGLPQTGLEVGSPVFHEGFFAPPNKTAISAWEDPSYIWKDIKSWSPLESFDHFKHFIKNVMKNIFDVIRIYQSFSRLSVTIIIIYILFLIARPFSKQALRGDIFNPFFTAILYTGGYIPFHLEHRYLWIVNILILLMGAYILTRLFQNEFFNSNLRKVVLIFFFTVSFMLTPTKSFLTAGKGNINKEMYTLGAMLRDKYDIHGNIASNREWVHIAVHDSWHKTFRLSYWLNSRYFGQAKKDISDEELERELKKYNIEYYFVWGESARIPKFLSQYREITNGEFPDLKIYSLKERVDSAGQ